MAQLCRKPSLVGTCLQSLAGGWILFVDLCPGCTRVAMAALDQASPEPLDWHSSYTERANAEAQ